MKMGKIFIVFIGILLWSNSLRLWAACEWEIDCDEAYWKTFNVPDKSTLGEADPNPTVWYTNLKKAVVDAAAGKKVRFLSYDLSYDSVGDFLQMAKKLPDLDHLRINFINGRKIDIPDAIGDLNALVSLSLSARVRINLPDTVANLTKLVYLSIDSNYAGGIPTEICQVPSLRYLDLTDDNLDELPECVGDLLDLEFLILRSNPIRSLPSTVVNLVNTTIKLGLSPDLMPKHLDPYKEANKGNIYLRDSDKDSYNLLRIYFNRDDKPKFKTAYRVTATSGLKLRDKPSLNGKKLGAIRYDLHVPVLETSTNTHQIEGKTANWYKVRAIANGKITEAWVWGGYLEKVGK